MDFRQEKRSGEERGTFLAKHKHNVHNLQLFFDAIIIMEMPQLEKCSLLLLQFVNI